MTHQNCLHKLKHHRCNKCSPQFSYLHRVLSRDILRCDHNPFHRHGRIHRLNNIQVYLLNFYKIILIKSYISLINDYHEELFERLDYYIIINIVTHIGYCLF